MDTSDEVAELRRRSSGTGRMIMALGVLLPLAFGGGVAVGQYVLGGRARAPVAPVAKPAPPPAPSATAPVTLVDRAAAGDYQALDDLKGKAADQRTAEETLALSRGRSHNKSAALEGFEKEIKKNTDLLNNKDQIQRLRDFLNDRETTNQAAGVIVGLTGTIGPDLFYEVVAAAKNKNETSQLAEDLLATKEVREKASPALGIVLDLRSATQCEAFKTLLPKIAEQGDRRAIPSLAKLTKKNGCGDNKLGDCFECLRPLEIEKDAIDVGKAIKAVAKRAAPKLGGG